MSAPIMPEYEILRLVQAIISNQYSILAQIVGLNSAMVVAVFVFLHKSGRMLQGFVFLMYTIGFAIYISILLSDSLQVLAAETALRELDAAGQLTHLGQSFLSGARMNIGHFTNVLTQIGIALLWVSMGFFTFFWKAPKDWSLQK